MCHSSFVTFDAQLNLLKGKGKNSSPNFQRSYWEPPKAAAQRNLLHNLLETRVAVVTSQQLDCHIVFDT